MSARYSEMPKEAWAPEPMDVRGQGQGNKQVGNGVLEEDERNLAALTISRCNHVVHNHYQDLLKQGVCREQARTVLPMGQYTEAYVTANLGDWLLFLKARLSPHAQLEIRVYAEAIYSIFCDLFPITMEAFKDYQVNGVKLSAQEMETLKAMLNSELGVFQKYFLETTERRIEKTGTVIDNTKASIFRQGRPSDLSSEDRKALLSKRLPTQRERQEFWRKIS